MGTIDEKLQRDYEEAAACFRRILNGYAAEKGCSVRSLAVDLDIPRSTIQGWLSCGQPRLPKAPALAELRAKVPAITAEQEAAWNAIRDRFLSAHSAANAQGDKVKKHELFRAVQSDGRAEKDEALVHLTQRDVQKLISFCISSLMMPVNILDLIMKANAEPMCDGDRTKIIDTVGRLLKAADIDRAKLRQLQSPKELDSNNRLLEDLFG